jgi:hypothetical protein
VRCAVRGRRSAADATQLVEAHERFLDQIIRAGGAGGDAYHNRAWRQPIFGNHFLALVQVVMQDLFLG